jgi:hypothetical protein
VLSETVHNVGYFAPEGRAATDSLGCKHLWIGYFGMRATPLGAVTAETVITMFVSFSPAMVRRAIPDVRSHPDERDQQRDHGSAQVATDGQTHGTDSAIFGPIDAREQPGQRGQHQHGMQRDPV